MRRVIFLILFILPFLFSCKEVAKTHEITGTKNIVKVELFAFRPYTSHGFYSLGHEDIESAVRRTISHGDRFDRKDVYYVVLNEKQVEEASKYYSYDLNECTSHDYLKKVSVQLQFTMSDSSIYLLGLRGFGGQLILDGNNRTYDCNGEFTRMLEKWLPNYFDTNPNGKPDIDDSCDCGANWEK